MNTLKLSINPYHAEYFYELHYTPPQFSSNLFARFKFIIMHFKQAEWKIVWILISWSFRSQLIWVNTVFWTYPCSAY